MTTGIRNPKRKFVLDYAKWICGSPENHDIPRLSCELSAVGRGATMLRNSYGYMCCLGQIGQQLGIEQLYDDASLFNLYLAIPERIRASGAYRKFPEAVRKFPEAFTLDFNNEMMKINDNEHTTVATKVVELRNVLHRYNCALVLKNFPTNILLEIARHANS